MTEDITPMYDEIKELVDAPLLGGEAPNLEELEHTLTSGYASALALEAERWRIERRIGEVAAKLKDDTSELHELAGLTERLSATDGDLTRLRGALSSLRVRASEARSSANP